jgi:succinyl-CoA synthetase alpha subunit
LHTFNSITEVLNLPYNKNMQLLEFQAKELLQLAGVMVPDAEVAQSISDITIDDLSFPVVVKSQVPVGGRGKLGGVKLVKHADEFPATFSEVKALEIKGYSPSHILVEAALEIKVELYLALRLNRDLRRIDVIASREGGVEIESHTSAIVSIPFDDPDRDDVISSALEIAKSDAITLLKALHDCMSNNDLLLLEINPLVVTETDMLVAADAKCLLDDNALFKYPAYANQAVSSSVMPLGGTIGVIANGAGMAMGTMDTIYAAGGHPANFLDIGGGTGEDVFIKNLREITTLPGVTSIIINIFAGITRCDDIARGIIAAKTQIPDLVPLYIRLEGTRRDEAAVLLEQANITMQPDLATCVELALWAERRAESGERRELQSSSADLLFEEHLLSPDTSAANPDSSRTKRSDPADDSDELQRVSRRENSRSDNNMSVLLKNFPVIVQGITGHHGSFHTKGMLDAGTNIVAGVTPGKAGQEVEGIPVYNSVEDAVADRNAMTSVIFVPPAFAKSAMLEAIDAGIKLIVCITEGIPVHDMLFVVNYATEHETTIVGPNCPGIIVPGSHKLGIIAAHITSPGHTAIISRSGTLTYELADALTKKGIGQRIVLGIGGDPVQGMNFSEALEICQTDPAVDQIVLVGEIGGTSEQIAAEYISNHVTKPVYGLVVGHSLPPGQQFGHAGAIVGGHGESAKEKTVFMMSKGLNMYQTLDELIKAI